MASHSQRRNRRNEQGQVRLIGGDWRRRTLSFPVVDGVRPTPDRVRETLFNWVMPFLAGSHCLDLFSGSGALGLEALSRGAASVTFVEHSPRLASALSQNLSTLNTRSGYVVNQDVLKWLRAPEFQESVRIVLMDPPFRADLIDPVCSTLAASGLLADNARIYIEHESEHAPSVPPEWALVRRKQAGQVAYSLFEVT
ncbi:16S rRNA (guanine(966)-N(2))-methyltransferase RsmD [Salicola sp. Rm-C-2C1-2]|uniref:16S rRNA (guanine(966)-N(2))-methyltransferase RsmD n=1 Tax=Salicola sp. Rm-C-2C1-2 TaxID=3141321 RepID=UPI0032E52B61